VGLRKGAPYLLEALRRIGPKRLDPSRLEKYTDVAEFMGAVPRNQVPELFRWADVFVLPSIVEGSATVTYEALLTGIPVITTPNAGSIVRDGTDGMIVPVRDSLALANAIEQYCEDRTLLHQHRASALLARSQADIRRYAEDLSKLFEPDKS
jgi:glycosyltransferase involved in cell wall biosynthesis